MTTTELKSYYSTQPLPESVRLKSCKVSDVKKMVTAHLRYLEMNEDRRFVEPYRDRLVELKEFIERQKLEKCTKK